jgi:hypothetical protein
MIIDLAPLSWDLTRLARAAIFGLAGAALLSASALNPAVAKSKATVQAKEDDSEAKSDSKSAKRGAKDQKIAIDRKDAKDKNDSKNQNGAKNNKELKSGNGFGKSEQIGSFSDWEAYATPGKDKTCYAMSRPKDRQPKAKLKDTQSYVFVSVRPGEGVKNEVAINLGYPTKENGAASASINEQEFELITKGTNAWLKNAAEEDKFVKAVKSGGKLVVKASSAKGTATTDAYSLKGFSQALERAQKECR